MEKMMMRRRSMMAPLGAALLALAACGGADESAENGAAGNGMDEAAADSGLFAQAERQMSEQMMAAVGTDAGDSWARKMLAHHQGAIDMSRIILAQNPPPDVAEMARMTIEKQQKDMEDIRKLLEDGPPDQPAAELYRAAMMDMQRKMEAATAATPAEEYMRKMLEHHRGGVALSDVALRNSVAGAMRAQVQKTRDDQLKDAEMVERMLQGQSHQDAMRAAGAKSAQQARAEPAPADKATAAAKPPASAPRPKPEAEAPPAAEPPPPTAPKPPETTCSPEHRAAGHC